VAASFQRVDTCAAEFQADTPYMYSSYDGSDECEPTNAKKVRLAVIAAIICECASARRTGAHTEQTNLCASTQDSGCTVRSSYIC